MATSKGQLGFEEFTTARPSTPLFCHQDYLEKLAAHHGDGIGRRAAFLMQRLAVDAKRLHYKSTSGENRGWRRSRLGGNQGSHFYAWWAPRKAAPLEGRDDFPEAEGGAIFLRDIRHHDDHSPLSPQSFDNYLELTVRDLRQDEYTPPPWTTPQARFAAARQAVRLLKGHPGSGKTTALWHAADSTGAGRVLYVTYSRDLAVLARDYFDRYCSAQRMYEVVTFPDLVRRLAGRSDTPAPERETRRLFSRDLAPFSRHLGAWTNCQNALYDEFHAHLIGDALPVTIGRFNACNQPRIPDKAYREKRTRFVGPAAASSALDTALRLERTVASGGLARRYFPELEIAWDALSRLLHRGPELSPELLEYDCIAVDECQDLTPLEACVLVEMAAAINAKRRAPIPFLLAGDEAQTVRPSDFEWGWLSDLLHFQVGSPVEHKLASNLRSPRRLAELVNGVWDLYSRVNKQDRPSGTGYAQIDDDATDQLLYCTAAPGSELEALLEDLAGREGLALISLEDTIPTFVPEAIRGSVLTVREAKGLDFHSVCILDAGRHVERILRDEERVRVDSDIEGLRKRLAIDQMRVALSRATERLLWLDVSPSDRVVRLSTTFLNNGLPVRDIRACVPAAVLKTLQEEELDPEERVQRCQMDARQFLDVRPEMAYSRARQAVTLLGSPGSPAAITDRAAREAAYLTLAEVCFVLALRGAKLPAELGRPDLFREAEDAATRIGRAGLARILGSVGRLHQCSAAERLPVSMDVVVAAVDYAKEIEPWLLVELQARSKPWLEELEANSASASLLAEQFPVYYELLQMPDAEARTQRFRQNQIDLAMKEKRFRYALQTLEKLQERSPKLEGVCFEGLEMFDKAAEAYRAAGSLKDALRCYRSIPDFSAALSLAREMNEESATKSLEWIGQLQDLVSQRPDNFTRSTTPAEKKLLESVLESALGVSRVKAVKKTAAASKKSPAKTPAVKKVAAPGKLATPRKRKTAGPVE